MPRQVIISRNACLPGDRRIPAARDASGAKFLSLDGLGATFGSASLSGSEQRGTRAVGLPHLARDLAGVLLQGEGVEAGADDDDVLLAVVGISDGARVALGIHLCFPK